MRPRSRFSDKVIGLFCMEPVLARSTFSVGARGRGPEGAEYRVLAPIERGGMGELVLAERQKPHYPAQHVVLKRLLTDLMDDDKYVSMFRSEAEVMSQLDHPNIVSVYGTPTVGGQQCLAMEYIRGRSAQQLLSRTEELSRAIPPQVALRVMIEVLRGLHYAHSFKASDGQPLNLVHRDVTPGNVLISYQGDIKLTDFGIAKSRMSMVSTTVGIVKGKARYLAPEQILGEPATVRSDIFSSAAVICELLTGVPAFDQGTVPKTLYAIVHGKIPNLERLLPFRAPMLIHTIQRALTVEPAKRIQSAKEFADLLERSLKDLGQFCEKQDVGLYLSDLFEGLDDPLAEYFDVDEATMQGGYPAIPVNAIIEDPQEETQVATSEDPGALRESERTDRSSSPAPSSQIIPNSGMMDRESTALSEPPLHIDFSSTGTQHNTVKASSPVPTDSLSPDLIPNTTRGAAQEFVDAIADIEQLEPAYANAATTHVVRGTPLVPPPPEVSEQPSTTVLDQAVQSSPEQTAEDLTNDPNGNASQAAVDEALSVLAWLQERQASQRLSEDSDTPIDGLEHVIQAQADLSDVVQAPTETALDEQLDPASRPNPQQLPEKMSAIGPMRLPVPQEKSRPPPAALFGAGLLCGVLLTLLLQALWPESQPATGALAASPAKTPVKAKAPPEVPKAPPEVQKTPETPAVVPPVTLTPTEQTEQTAQTAQAVQAVETAQVEQPPPPPKPPAFAILDITFPRNARVRLNGNLLKERVPIKGLELEAGHHEFTVRKGRYRKRVKLDVEGGEKYRMTRRLKRED